MDTSLFQSETPQRPRRIELLGQKVDLVTPEEVLAFVADAAERRRAAVVANHNLHSVCLARRSPAMAAFYARADLIEIDSTPLVKWATLLGLPATAAHRCTYLDWRDDFWRMAAERGWRVFYLGGAPGVAAKAAERLMQRWPGVDIAVHDGFFDRSEGSAEDAAVVEQINAFSPHVLFVGMGMPLQEEWIGRHRAELEAGAVLPVGAAFDYEAGVQTAAPRALGRLGLEWLFRLAHDPQRLFHRYMVEPWSLLGPAGADLMRGAFAPAPASPGAEAEPARA
jgi:N-acetylglucosaminyldiphosphoundecaprenol N-acetyl-beta-D-mannosaminyltransferase